MRRLLASLIVLNSAASASVQDTTHRYPPTGQLIDVGGRKLHLHCTGRGAPTIVLVAGGGAYAIDWTLVRNLTDSTTRVCAFDRAGLGWSDSGPADETVEQTVGDLHTVLLRAGEKPPLLLVGASIGGIFIRAYHHTFPEDVAGLVFANTAGRVGKFVPGKSGLLWDLSEADLRSAYPLPESVTKGPAPSRTTAPFDRLPGDLPAVRLWFDVRRWESWDRTEATVDADLSWRREFLREFDQKCSRQNPLDVIPLIVVSSNPKPEPPDSQGAWPPACQRDNASEGLDRLSSNSLHVVAAGSGHEIHLFQPNVLAEALVRAVTGIRTGTPLSRPVRPRRRRTRRRDRRSRP